MNRMRASYRNGGFSYSSNALLVMDGGRMTMTTQVKARRILELTHDGEWHHVSQYANRVPFYDVHKAVAWVACCGGTRNLFCETARSPPTTIPTAMIAVSSTVSSKKKKG
jgi:hypothetical protein